MRKTTNDQSDVGHDVISNQPTVAYVFALRRQITPDVIDAYYDVVTPSKDGAQDRGGWLGSGANAIVWKVLDKRDCMVKAYRYAALDVKTTNHLNLYLHRQLQTPHIKSKKKK